jgi:NDP-sugar pyrophosphorylase family protein
VNAIILAGGLGTRLRPLTLNRPKALLPLLSRSVLDHQLQWLKTAGVRHVMLAAARALKRWEYALPRPAGPITLHVCYERSPLGTGGAARFAFDMLKRRRVEGAQGRDPLLVLNGDVLLDFDVRRLCRFHRKARAEGTIAVGAVDDASRYGAVSLRRDGRIGRFREKPRSRSRGDLVNTGVYLLDPSLLGRLPRDRTLSLEREVFPRLLRTRRRLFGYLVGGTWIDIGTPAGYLEAHGFLLARVDGRLRRSARGAGVIWRGAAATVARTVRVEGFLACGPGTRIAEECRIRDSVLLERVRVGRGTRMARSIVGPDTRIGRYCDLGEGTVVGSRGILPDFTRC